MKIRLTQIERILLVAVALLLLLNGVAFMGFIQGEDERTSLNKELARQQEAATKLQREANVEALKTELDDTKAKLASAQAVFPKRVPSLEILSLLVQSAQNSGVEINSAALAEVKKEKIGTQEYLSTRFSVKAVALPAQASALLKDMEKGPFPTLHASALTLNIDPVSGNWIASFDLTVYSQPP
ncbi:MAG: hypothetical protein HYU86_05720 [Chloroflexi bacterium]|nr:hypothetical protein [Chloroflexota bacterium]